MGFYEEKMERALTDLRNKREQITRVNERLDDLFLDGITYTNEKGERRVSASKGESEEFLKTLVDKPLHEVERKNARPSMMRMFCLTKGMTPQEIFSLGNVPPNEATHEAEERVKAFRQEYIDIVDSKDTGRIAKLYSDISQSLCQRDFSSLSKLTDIQSMNEHYVDIAMLGGGQSVFEQNLYLGDMHGRDPSLEQKAIVDKVSQDLQPQNMNFYHVADTMKIVDLMEQKMSSAVKGFEFKNGSVVYDSEKFKAVQSYFGGIRNASKTCEGCNTLKEISSIPNGCEDMLSSFVVFHSLDKEKLFDAAFDVISGNPKGIDVYQASGNLNTFAELYPTSLNLEDINKVFKMSQDDFTKRIKEIVNDKKTFTKADLIRYVGNQDSLISSKDQKLMEEVYRGDFSHFEKMSVASRNALASNYALKNDKIFSMSPDKAVVELERRAAVKGTNEFQNPLLRLAVSLKMRDADPKTVQQMKELDAKLNQAVMKKTLLPPTAEAINRLTVQNPQGVAATLEANKRSQAIMGKTMLLAQLGQMTVKNGEVDTFWRGSVANAFAHCSRVNLSLPAGEKDQSEIFGAYLRQDPDSDGVVKKRSAATHSVVLSKVDDGLEMEEKKGTCLSHQYGMNVAIGGIGNVGIQGPNVTNPRLLSNDGSCGHMYMHIQKGTDKSYGGMLIGFESDAAGVTNQMGHTHDIFATPEKSSSFGGQRTDEIGNKYGGRSIDLRALSKDDILAVMSAYEQKVLNAENNHGDLSGFYDKLCGDAMSPEQLRNFLEQDLEINANKTAEIMSHCTMTEMSEKNMQDLSVLYDSSKNYLDVNIIEIKERELPADRLNVYREAINNMPDGTGKAEAMQVLEIMERQNVIGNQQNEISIRMGAIKQMSSMVKDPTTPIRVRGYAMQQERLASIRKEEAYAASEKAEDYLREMCGKKEKTSTPEEREQFIQQKGTQLPVANLRTAALGQTRTVTTKDDYNQLSAKMSTNKRSFLGIKLSSSSSYKSVLEQIDKIKDLHEKEFDGNTLHEMSVAYEDLGAACKQYIKDHPNPLTADGKERLSMVKETLKGKEDVSFNKFMNQETFHAEQGKKWKNVDYTMTSEEKQIRDTELATKKVEATKTKTSLAEIGKEDAKAKEGSEKKSKSGFFRKSSSKQKQETVKQTVKEEKTLKTEQPTMKK